MRILDLGCLARRFKKRHNNNAFSQTLAQVAAAVCFRGQYVRTGICLAAGSRLPWLQPIGAGPLPRGFCGYDAARAGQILLQRISLPEIASHAGRHCAWLRCFSLLHFWLWENYELRFPMSRSRPSFSIAVGPFGVM